MDFTSASRLGLGMDEHDADMVAQLCARAGMIMEDVSPDAITLPGKSLAERRHVIGQRQVAIRRVKALVDAAEALTN